MDKGSVTDTASSDADIYTLFGKRFFERKPLAEKRRQLPDYCERR